MGESDFEGEPEGAERIDCEETTDGRAPLTCSTDPPMSGWHFSIAGSKTPRWSARESSRVEESIGVAAVDVAYSENVRSITGFERCPISNGLPVAVGGAETRDVFLWIHIDIRGHEYEPT